MAALQLIESRNYSDFDWIKYGILCIDYCVYLSLQVAFLSRYNRCSAKAFEALSVVSVMNENKAALRLVDVNKKIVECDHLTTFLWLYQYSFANLRSMQL